MIILGSKSPRRKEILKKAGIEFTVVTKDVIEDINETNPEEYAKKTALKKAVAITKEYENDIVICADTIVAIENRILGKPKDKNDARQMITSLSGKTHKVITGVFLGTKNNYTLFASKTFVRVKEMTKEDIEEYISLDEPYDKAGGYAVQGEFAKYIESLDGDYDNVVGLPIKEIEKRLKEFRKR